MDCPATQCSDEQLVRHAIDQLRQYHLAYPFALLRERAVQAALKRYLDEALHPQDNLVRACIYSRTKPDAIALNSSKDALVIRTERVRLEARMRSAHTWTQVRSAEGKEADQGMEEKSTTESDKEVNKVVDIAVFRSTLNTETAPVRLQNYGHGLGDISAATHEEDVSCLIEIKASPTHNKQEAVKFGHDIDYLLRSQSRRRELKCFFICLDKTSAFYGDYHLGAKALPAEHLNWSLCHGQPLGMPLLALLQQSFARSFLHIERLKDIWISQTVPDSAAYVEVFNLSTRDPQQYHYYAYLQPSAA